MRLTIKMKLALTFTVIFVVAGGMAWMAAIRSLSSINATLDTMLKGPVARVELVGEIENRMLRAIQAEKDMIMAETPEQIRLYEGTLIKERSELSSKIEKFQSIASAEGRQKMASVSSVLQQWIQNQEKIRDLASHNGQEEAKGLSIKKGRALAGQVETALAGIAELSQRLMKEAEAESAHQYSRAMETLVMVVAVMLMIGCAAADLILSSQGGLSAGAQPLWNKDMLGTSLKRMAGKLRTLAGDALSLMPATVARARRLADMLLRAPA